MKNKEQLRIANEQDLELATSIAREVYQLLDKEADTLNMFVKELPGDQVNVILDQSSHPEVQELMNLKGILRVDHNTVAQVKNS